MSLSKRVLDDLSREEPRDDSESEDAGSDSDR